MRTARAIFAAILIGSALVTTAGSRASAASPLTLDLRVLLVGGPASDPTTSAWQAALQSEGVAFTQVTAAGTYGSETVTLPPLVDPSNSQTGLFNGVVIADDPNAFMAGQLSSVYSYESTFGVRQVDGFVFPTTTNGLTDVSAGDLSNTTPELTSSGLAAFPALKGPVPFDVGTYGYPATISGSLPAGSSFTPFLEDTSSDILMGVYQHAASASDPQSGVSELVMAFDYNQFMLQWLLLSNGAIDWVTQGEHLGLYRNYFGQEVDDVFTPDNEWSAQFQCTPGAIDPPDFTCPAGVADNPADTPPDDHMNASDVDYVANWEAQTGVKLEFVFNADGACEAPSTATESTANCTATESVNGTPYTLPGQDVETVYPDLSGWVNEALAKQSSFNWVNHTWSHEFLGCHVAQPMPVTSIAGGDGGSLSAGTYYYEITAATAYGESEPSLTQSATVPDGGSATLVWPDAPNGEGPTLYQEEATHTGGSGFWGYDIYRSSSASGPFQLVGQTPEDPTGSATSYDFTDTGTAVPGGSPSSTSTFPTATNPGIACADGGWYPATSSSPDSSISQEMALDVAFAKANGLTNFDPTAVVTGEHSGLESPQMPTAVSVTGVKTLASDASRQPNQYSIGSAATAPRYPSNIYFNASNWPDEISEYNTLYVEPGVSINDPTYTTETGHCVATAVTTCLTAPVGEAGILSSGSKIELSHILNNDPRVGYAHQSNLIGPAQVNGVDYGYTLLDFLNTVFSQYNAWSNVPLSQVNLNGEAQILAEQSAWNSALSGGSVTASEANGQVTITNSGGSAVNVPVTAPVGTVTGSAPFGQAYGGTLSDWTSVAPGSSTVLTLASAVPAITSPNTATATVGTPFTFTVTTSEAPVASLSESGALPPGISFTDNGDGTATIAGTPRTGTGGGYSLSITASNGVGPNATQAFTLTVQQAPAFTSGTSATATIGSAFSFAVTTAGFPTPALGATGALPSGISFTDNGNGTATIAGKPAIGSAGNYPLSLSAGNGVGPGAVQAFSLNVVIPPTPMFTSPASYTSGVGVPISFAVTTTGIPTPTLSFSGKLPSGVSFTPHSDGTATIAGVVAAGNGGSYSLTIKAKNSAGATSQAFTLVIQQAPAITSANSLTVSFGKHFSFAVQTSGYPVPAISETGALPSGVSFVTNGNGGATISGTPRQRGIFQIVIVATNAVSQASEGFTLTVK